MLRFRFLTGDGNWKKYGGKFISKRLNNGEFDYWLIIEVINYHEASGDESGDKYYVSIEAVSPQWAGKENVDQALGSCGFSDEILERYENDPIFQVEALSDYGILALLWQESGNNIHKLLKAARRQSQIIHGLFGFYMDRAGNRMGQSNWDLMRGQDISEFLASI